jgi:hypothetical protein
VLPQLSDDDRSERPVLLAVDQEREGARFRVPPELADPVGPLEVGEQKDVRSLAESDP